VNDEERDPNSLTDSPHRSARQGFCENPHRCDANPDLFFEIDFYANMPAISRYNSLAMQYE
jgi:hypothetical protein